MDWSLLGAAGMAATAFGAYYFAEPLVTKVMHETPSSLARKMNAEPTNCQEMAPVAVAELVEKYGVHMYLKTDPLEVANRSFVVREVTTVGARGATSWCTGVLRLNPETLGEYDTNHERVETPIEGADAFTSFFGLVMGQGTLTMLVGVQDHYPMEIMYRVMRTDSGGYRVVVDHDPIASLVGN